MPGSGREASSAPNVASCRDDGAVAQVPCPPLSTPLPPGIVLEMGGVCLDLRAVK